MTPGVLIPCAAHVPPRCRVRRKSVCEIHAGHRAAINALYPKIESKTGPRTDQNVVRRYPKPFKIQPGGHKHTQMRPRDAQEQPRGAQKTPRNAQETPKGSQEVAKSDPKNGKNAPRRFPESSKIDSGTFPAHLGCVFRRNLCSKGSGIRFRSIFARCVQAQTLIFTAPASVL
jgi:hypothetical protein